MDVIKHQPKALEMVLVKEAGYNLADIRGERTERVETVEREGVLATLRRILPWCSPPTPRVRHVVEETPGMSRKEVLGRVVQHDEHERMRKEDAEAQARKAERRAKSGGKHG